MTLGGGALGVEDVLGLGMAAGEKGVPRGQECTRGRTRRRRGRRRSCRTRQQQDGSPRTWRELREAYREDEVVGEEDGAVVRKEAQHGEGRILAHGLGVSRAQSALLHI